MFPSWGLREASTRVAESSEEVEQQIAGKRAEDNMLRWRIGGDAGYGESWPSNTIRLSAVKMTALWIGCRGSTAR